MKAVQVAYLYESRTTMHGDAELMDNRRVGGVMAGHLSRFQTRLPPEKGKCVYCSKMQAIAFSQLRLLI